MISIRTFDITYRVASSYTRRQKFCNVFQLYEASKDMTIFKSQAPHIIRINYCNAGGSGNPPSIISSLWNKALYFIKRPPVPKMLTTSVYSNGYQAVFFNSVCLLKTFLNNAVIL